MGAVVARKPERKPEVEERKDTEVNADLEDAPVPFDGIPMTFATAPHRNRFNVAPVEINEHNH